MYFNLVKFTVKKQLRDLIKIIHIYSCRSIKKKAKVEKGNYTALTSLAGGS